jgi:hypothetical protein
MSPVTGTSAARLGSEFFHRRVMYARRKVVHAVLRTANMMTRSLWQNAPLAVAPRADRETYLRLFESARGVSYPEVDRFEREIGAAIDRSFLDELALHTQVVVKDSPLMWPHGRILYSALTDYLQKHPAGGPTDRITILETGTARGFSALCMAKALQDAARPGVILTTDIVPHEQKIFWNCIDDLEGKRSRRELLEPWQDLVSRFIVFLWGDSISILPSLSADRIHFAFIDGAHSYDDVMFEFKHVAAKQKSGDLIVFDDVNKTQFPGIFRAVEDICTRYGYSRRDISSGGPRHYVIAQRSA